MDKYIITIFQIYIWKIYLGAYTSGYILLDNQKFSLHAIQYSIILSSYIIILLNWYSSSV